MNILGISAFYHDSASCLVRDGEILAAAQEERFSRKKHDSSFPRKAIDYCLSEAGITIDDLDIVAFYEKPFLKFERIVQTYLAFAPRGIRSFMQALPIWLKDKIWMKEYIKRELKFTGDIVFPEHHESHAASAFFPSPFSEAAFLTVDGVGEWTTTSFGIGQGNEIRILSELHFPHSLGLLYAAFTYFAGFKVNSGEYKLMGLAPYGKPIYKDKILSELIDVKSDGSFRLNLKYFDYCTGLRMVNERFAKLFDGPLREAESPLTQREMDLARSIQDATEEILLKIANHVYQQTGQRNLCLAGGVALNCVANSRILREGPFDNLWIQPAAGDAGGALGAALLAHYQFLGQERKPKFRDSQHGSYLGPVFTENQILSFLKDRELEYIRLKTGDIPEKIASLIADQKVIGLFHGRMEFGPRALGHRSIVGDARSPMMQKILNLKIKFRESFRPFAPAVLAERAADYFELPVESPYMLFTAPVAPSRRVALSAEESRRSGMDLLSVRRSSIPAVTHVDYSARLQTVRREDSEFFHDILEFFDQQYDCPVIINTSFNVRGEPIVCTPEDAYRCFLRTDMDFLLMGNFLLDKRCQKISTQDTNWQQEFALD